MIPILIIIYIAAVAIGIYLCAQLFPFTGGTEGTKNFGVAATVVVAAISGVMTAIVGLFTLHRNVASQITLKRLEDELVNKRDFTKSTKDAGVAHRSHNRTLAPPENGKSRMGFCKQGYDGGGVRQGDPAAYLLP